jgi:hypothetical protein
MKHEDVLVIVRTQAEAEDYRKRWVRKKKTHNMAAIVDPCTLNNYVHPDALTEIIAEGLEQTEEPNESYL